MGTEENTTPEPNAKALVKDLGSAIKRLEKLREQLQDVDRFSRDLEGKAFAAAGALASAEKSANDAKQALAFVHNLPGDLQSLRQVIDRAKSRLRDRVGAGIAEAVKDLGLPISGRFPTLQVGPFAVTLKPDKGISEIALGASGPVLAETSLEAETVGKAVADEYARWFADDFDAPAFLDLAHRALSRATRVADQPANAVVSISAFLLELNAVAQSKAFCADPNLRRFKPYTRLMVSVHLFRARPLRGDDFEIRLAVATREQTRKKEDHIYVPTDLRGHGTNFGGLELRGERTRG